MLIARRWFVESMIPSKDLHLCRLVLSNFQSCAFLIVSLALNPVFHHHLPWYNGHFNPFHVTGYSMPHSLGLKVNDFMGHVASHAMPGTVGLWAGTLRDNLKRLNPCEASCREFDWNQEAASCLEQGLNVPTMPMEFHVGQIHGYLWYTLLLIYTVVVGLW